MKQNRLSSFEIIAQEMVEGKFGRLFGGRLQPFDVASRLAWALEDSVEDGQIAAAYQVALNPADLHSLTLDNPHLADNLAEVAWQIVRRAGLVAAEKPHVALMAAPEIRRHQIRIAVQPDDNAIEQNEITRTYSRNRHQEASLAALKDLDAFLIIQGRRHVPLDRPLITIGRRTENDVVLDLPSVSRQHAQIRWRFGHFILYDVSSRGRTLVNGHGAREHVLQPGDVISLSEALLVYGEGINDELRQRIDTADDQSKTLIRPPKNS